MKKLRGMSRGFTLIELLIVLAVIAALLAIVTPIALNAVKQAKITNVAATIRNIRSAAESYIYVEKPATPTSVTLEELYNKNYLNTEPTGFDLSFSSWGTDGSATGKIKYTGGDVTVADLQKVLPEAKDVDGSPGIEFKVVKYW
ncbi:MAG: type II secretion system protein [Thermotoga caldifontis]|uniref:type II secretion system protein n=1 Tax=Thermotoga caldifontis TaxID=1508419 RepID=UPI003C7AFDD1